MASRRVTPGRCGLPQCFHQINYPYRRPPPWFVDPLTALFPLDQFAKHLLVPILEFFRLEMASSRGDDVRQGPASLSAISCPAGHRNNPTPWIS
jgi:hypothetical protein